LYFARNANLVYATTINSPLILENVVVPDAPVPVNSNNWLQSGGATGVGTQFKISNVNANAGALTNWYWYTNWLPNNTIGGNATIPGGNYYIQVAKGGNGSLNQIIAIGVQLLLTSNNGATKAVLATNTFNITERTAIGTKVQNLIGNVATYTPAGANPNRLAVRLYYSTANGNAGNANTYLNLMMANSGATSILIMPGNITVPEIPKAFVFMAILIIIPSIPTIVAGRRRGKSGEEITKDVLDNWRRLIKILLGVGEEDLDKLPV
jgi:hypothetical protein